jgi:hypothetical protein
MAKATDSKVDALALAVSSGASVSAAARELHINISIFRNLSQRPEFWPRVAEHRKAIVQQITGKLAEAGISAASVLVELLGSGNPADVRLRACKEILAGYLNVVSQQELADRLTALEQRITEGDRLL